MGTAAGTQDGVAGPSSQVAHLKLTLMFVLAGLVALVAWGAGPTPFAATQFDYGDGTLGRSLVGTVFGLIGSRCWPATAVGSTRLSSYLAVVVTFLFGGTRSHAFGVL